MNSDDYLRELRIEELTITCSSRGNWHALYNKDIWAHGKSLKEVLKDIHRQVCNKSENK